MIRTQIQLTDEQAAGLKCLSAEKGGSMAEWIRKRRRSSAPRNRREPSWEERKKRALAVVGIGHSDLETSPKITTPIWKKLILGRKP